MPYGILWDPKAEKKFKKLQKPERRRMREAIEALADEPRPNQVRKMTGVYAGYYRIPIGRHYRVLYSIDDDASTIVIVKVGSHEEIY